MFLEARLICLQSYLSRDVAGMEEGRHCIGGLYLVFCDMSCITINNSAGVGVLDCDDIWVWVNKPPLKTRISICPFQKGPPAKKSSKALKNNYSSREKQCCVPQ